MSLKFALMWNIFLNKISNLLYDIGLSHDILTLRNVNLIFTIHYAFWNCIGVANGGEKLPDER